MTIPVRPYYNDLLCLLFCCCAAKVVKADVEPLIDVCV